LNLFLRYRYTPSPTPLFKGSKARPGHQADGRKRSLSPQPVVPFQACAVPGGESADEATEELLALYQQAVRRQLISDVPVGLLLAVASIPACCSP